MILGQRRTNNLALLRAAIIAVLLFAAFALGRRASFTYLALPVVAIAALVLVLRPQIGPALLVILALMLPRDIPTGSEVFLNLSSVFVPVLGVVWLFRMAGARDFKIAASHVNLPMMIFLLAGILSLLIGNATWDPTVLRKDTFALVQLAQWAIFAVAFLSFWLGANLLRTEKHLRWLWGVFLAAGLVVASVRALGYLQDSIPPVATLASMRAPFWMLLAAVAGSLVFFGGGLSKRWQVAAYLALAISLYFCFVSQRETLSNWAGVAVALGVLVWLRFPRLRWPIVVLVVALAFLGVLAPAIWSFAGGDAEWNVSGNSRLVLIQRVIGVTMRNPITGLGPAAYRPYTMMTPLQYGAAYWVQPTINSHNNYVDIFAHMGLLGLALFVWIIAEIAALGLRLRRRYRHGMGAVYVNAMLAAGAASLVIMLLADWMLPFVYNISFEGFQAAIPVWLMLGGLVALDNMPDGALSS